MGNACHNDKNSSNYAKTIIHHQGKTGTFISNDTILSLSEIPYKIFSLLKFTDSCIISLHNGPLNFPFHISYWIQIHFKNFVTNNCKIRVGMFGQKSEITCL